MVGKLGYVSFPMASYAYVGSAMNSLNARLARHIRDEKKLHWHINYLLQEAEIDEIILCPSEERVECSLSQALARELEYIPGFGSSDCKCQSHLYLTNGEYRLKAEVSKAIKHTWLFR